MPQYVLEALEEKLEYVGIKPVHSLKGVPLEGKLSLNSFR